MKTTQLTIALIAASAHAQSMPTFEDFGPLTPTFDNSAAMRQSFLSYTSRWGKSYSSTAEWESRLELFAVKDEKIRNFKSTKMTVAHNQFSDWTAQELANLLPVRKTTPWKEMEPFKAAVDRTRNLQNSLTGCKTLNDDGTTCQKCHNLSWDLQDDGQCHCEHNQISNNGKICLTCRDGYFWDEDKKRCCVCPHYCNSCSEKNVCEECDPGFALFTRTNGKAICRCNYDITGGVCQDPDYLDSLEDDEDDVTPTPTDEDEVNDPDDMCDDGLYYIEKFDLCVYCASDCAKCSDYWGCEECDSGYKINVLDEDGWFECVVDDGDDEEEPVGPVNPDAQTEDDCTDAQWFNDVQLACLDCMEDCAECSAEDVCDVCSSPFEVQTSGECDCADGTVYFNGQCATPTGVTCPDGQYNNGSDVCENCGEGCAICEWGQGECKECETDLSFNDDAVTCSDCSIKIGKVDDPFTCVNEAYNDKRIVEPYDSRATSVDWRDWGVVEDVVNQGSCGSCYAFSTIAAAESVYAIKTGELYKLSEQHIVACDTQNSACNGGLQWWASEFLKDDGTILDSDYPYAEVSTYSNSDVESCQSSGKDRVFYLEGSRGYEVVGSSYDSYKEALRIEPINISFAVGDNFMSYSSGIYDGEGDCASQLNHAMQAVGYGVESDGTEYTLIRNSWNESWGIDGYAKVELIAGTEGVCGVYTDNTFTDVGYLE